MTPTIIFPDGSAIDSDGLTAAQRILIADGLPPAAIIPQSERAECWHGRKLTKPRDLKIPRKDEDPATTKLRKEVAAAEAAKKAERFARLKELKQETAMKTNAKTKTSKADQLKGLRERRAAKGAPSAKKAAGSKNAAKAKARTPAAANAPTGDPKAIKAGSKIETVVAMLKRKEGCTSKEVCEATGWGAVSIPPIARRAGIEITKTKDGAETRYNAA